MGHDVCARGGGERDRKREREVKEWDAYGTLTSAGVTLAVGDLRTKTQSRDQKIKRKRDLKQQNSLTYRDIFPLKEIQTLKSVQ